MDYSYRDIYPTMGVTETSTEAIPNPVEQAALHEDEKTINNPKVARGKYVGLAIVVLACAVVFLGSVK